MSIDDTAVPTIPGSTTTATLLTRARARIAERLNWCSDVAQARNKEGKEVAPSDPSATSWSLVGAIQVVSVSEDDATYIDVISAVAIVAAALPPLETERERLIKLLGEMPSLKHGARDVVLLVLEDCLGTFNNAASHWDVLAVLDRALAWQQEEEEG